MPAEPVTVATRTLDRLNGGFGTSAGRPERNAEAASAHTAQSRALRAPGDKMTSRPGRRMCVLPLAQEPCPRRSHGIPFSLEGLPSRERCRARRAARWTAACIDVSVEDERAKQRISERGPVGRRRVQGAGSFDRVLQHRKVRKAIRMPVRWLDRPHVPKDATSDVMQFQVESHFHRLHRREEVVAIP